MRHISCLIFIMLAFATSSCLPDQTLVESVSFPNPIAPVFSKQGFSQLPFAKQISNANNLNQQNISNITIDVPKKGESVYLFSVNRQTHSVTVYENDGTPPIRNGSDMRLSLLIRQTSDKDHEEQLNFVIQYSDAFVRVIDTVSRQQATLEISESTSGSQKATIQTKVGDIEGILTVILMDISENESQGQTEEGKNIAPFTGDKTHKPIRPRDGSDHGMVNILVKKSEDPPSVEAKQTSIDERENTNLDNDQPQDRQSSSIDKNALPVPNKDTIPSLPDSPSKSPQQNSNSQPDKSSSTDAEQDSKSSSFAVSKEGNQITHPSNVDIVMVIDSTPSSLIDDPKKDRLEAARALLTAVMDGDQIGLVHYSLHRETTPLSEIVQGGPRDSTQKARLKKAIESKIEYGVFTKTLGIQEACDELIKNGRAGHRAAIIISNGLLDKNVTRGRFGLPELCFQENGWNIYTVGMGRYNSNLLTEIAESTKDGHFTGVSKNSAIELLCLVHLIRSDMVDGPTSSCQKRTISSGQNITFKLNVPPALKKASFAINWLNASYDIELRAKEPVEAGRRRTLFRSMTPRDISHDYQVGEKSFDIYGIENPIAGQWEITIKENNIPLGESAEVVFSFGGIPAS